MPVKTILLLMVTGILLPAASLRAQTQTPDIAIIGDSIFAFPLGKKISRHLQDTYDKPIADYAVNGAVLLEKHGSRNTGSVIPRQYTSFVKRDIAGLRILIMDGGGNDVFANERDCIENSCPALQEDISTGLDDFFATLADDGVDHVIYLGYFGVKGFKADLREFQDIAVDNIRSQCEGAVVDCTYVDPRAEFAARDPLERLIFLDGIHPTSAGSKVLAEMIRTELVRLDAGL